MEKGSHSVNFKRPSVIAVNPNLKENNSKVSRATQTPKDTTLQTLAIERDIYKCAFGKLKMQHEQLRLGLKYNWVEYMNV